jgi:SAM-dependent methyltransferase
MNLSNDETLRVSLRNRGMNRQRGLKQYNDQLGLDIVSFANQRLRKTGRFYWFDLCCGYFVAKDEFLSETEEESGDIDIVGIDLDPRKEGIVPANSVRYKIPKNADLVTCLQGVDYIQTYLRQGAQAIQNWYNCLGDGAVLAFDVANNHIMVKGTDISDHLKSLLDSDAEVFPTPERESTHKTVKIVCRDRALQLPVSRGIYA